jgi:hypothetical protein
LQTRLYPTASLGRSRLVAAGGHALLVVLGGLVVGVDDGVGGHAVGVVGLGPGVDGVDIVEHGHGEEGEHPAAYQRGASGSAQSGARRGPRRNTPQPHAESSGSVAAPPRHAFRVQPPGQTPGWSRLQHRWRARKQLPAARARRARALSHPLRALELCAEMLRARPGCAAQVRAIILGLVTLEIDDVSFLSAVSFEKKELLWKNKNHPVVFLEYLFLKKNRAH